jgi:hypothetical protein
MPRGSPAFGRSSQATAVSARIRCAHSAGALTALGDGRRGRQPARVQHHGVGAGGGERLQHRGVDRPVDRPRQALVGCGPELGPEHVTADLEGRLAVGPVPDQGRKVGVGVGEGGGLVGAGGLLEVLQEAAGVAGAGVAGRHHGRGPTLAEPPAPGHGGGLLHQQPVDHHGQPRRPRSRQLGGGRPERPARGEQAGEPVVDELATGVAVGWLVERHQQGGAQRPVRACREPDGEGAEPGRQRTGAEGLDPHRQRQDGPGAARPELRWHGDPPLLQAEGRPGRDLGAGRGEAVQLRQPLRRPAGGGEQVGQVRAGGHRLPDEDLHAEVAQRHLAAVAHLDAVGERRPGADHRRDGDEHHLQGGTGLLRPCPPRHRQPRRDRQEDR